MKEPKRLLSHGATDFERQLLRAVVSERPSALLRSRMQRGLGLVGPLAWASNVKAMFGTVTSRAVAGVALAGVVASGGFVAVHGLTRAEANDSVVIAPLLEASIPEAPRVRPSPVAPLPPAVPVPAVPVPAVPVPVVPVPVVATTEPASVDVANDDNQLREEIALLDTARAALQRSDREGARASLNIYRERFPTGILRREANLLRGRADAK